MVRTYRVPLAQEEADVLFSLPKLHGAVVNPEYAPRTPEAGRYLDELFAWCDRGKFSTSVWPQWLYEWHVARKAAAQRAALSDGDRGGDAGGLPAASTG